MDNRTFEDGDMVISKRFGVCHVSRITTNVVKVKSIDDDLFFGTDGRFMEFEIEPDIVTIRTPRKGSKEARDICAMLLREYIKFVKFYIFEGCGFERPYHNKEIKHYYDDWKSKHSIYLCYKKAKSMLK